MINITARGFELKQGTKDGIEKELKRIEKMLPDSAEFDVTLAKKKDGYKCDITVVNVGSFIRGEARADRIEPVVDMAVVIEHGYPVKTLMQQVQKSVRNEIEYITGMSIERMSIKVKNIIETKRKIVKV
jgi:ribosome-associated translation inhibitor RaiA